MRASPAWLLGLAACAQGAVTDTILVPFPLGADQGTELLWLSAAPDQPSVLDVAAPFTLDLGTSGDLALEALLYTDAPQELGLVAGPASLAKGTAYRPRGAYSLRVQGGSPGAWAPLAQPSARLGGYELRAPVRALARGLSEVATCLVLADGTVRCFGDPSDGLGGALGGSRLLRLPAPVEEVAMGYAFACARTAAGAVYCWGRNDDGQLGGARAEATVRDPVPIPGIPPAVELRAGYARACARSAAGEVWCWGRENALVLRPRPERIEFPAPVVRFDVGDNLACGIDAAGGVSCFGHNGNCQSLPGGLAMPVPMQSLPFPRPAVAVALGDLHGCALLEGRDLFCWGCNGNGLVGDGATEDVTVPKLILQGVVSVDLGWRTSCAVLGTGTVSCWGDGGSGELGDGMERITDRPVTAVDLLGVTEVVMHWSHACALDGDGAAFCWGQGRAGKLGSDVMKSSRPLPVGL